jgi:hypothetical protein
VLFIYNFLLVQIFSKTLSDKDSFGCGVITNLGTELTTLAAPLLRLLLCLSFDFSVITTECQYKNKVL